MNLQRHANSLIIKVYFYLFGHTLLHYTIPISRVKYSTESFQPSIFVWYESTLGCRLFIFLNLVNGKCVYDCIL